MSLTNEINLIQTFVALVSNYDIFCNALLKFVNTIGPVERKIFNNNDPFGIKM